MLAVTDAARNQIVALMANREAKDSALRVAVLGRRAGRWVYDLAFVGQDSRSPDDIVVDAGPFQVFVDPQSAEHLDGAKIDFIDRDGFRGFGIENPNPVWTDPSAQAIQKLFDEELNPSLALHGGLVSLTDVRDGVAYIAFGGGCQGCASVDVTLREGVEVRIKEVVPEIHEVVDTTDHGQGTNPYYETAPDTE
jgi:Fe/S biogenesis protein NfuA